MVCATVEAFTNILLNNYKIPVILNINYVNFSFHLVSFLLRFYSRGRFYLVFSWSHMCLAWFLFLVTPLLIVNLLMMNMKNSLKGNVYAPNGMQIYFQVSIAFIKSHAITFCEMDSEDIKVVLYYLRRK